MNAAIISMLSSVEPIVVPEFAKEMFFLAWLIAAPGVLVALIVHLIRN